MRRAPCRDAAPLRTDDMDRTRAGLYDRSMSSTFRAYQAITTGDSIQRGVTSMSTDDLPPTALWWRSTGRA